MDNMHRIELVPELSHRVETVAENKSSESLHQLLAASEGIAGLEPPNTSCGLSEVSPTWGLRELAAASMLAHD